MNTRRARTAARIVLLAAILIWLVLWLNFPHRFVASDPWTYSWNAYQMALGNFFRSPPYEVLVHRLAVIMPTALFYRLFGVNILSTNLLPLLASLLLIVTVYAALPSPAAKLYGVLLTASSVTLFAQSTELLSDVITAALMALSALFLAKRRNSLRAGRWWLYPTLAMFFLFAAFLAKLSAYWLLPLWLLVFLNDLRSEQGARALVARFYIPALLLGVALGVAYLIVTYLIWGDPLARFKEIQQLTGVHLWAWRDVSRSVWLARLTYAPLQLLWQDHGIVLILAAVAVPFAAKQMRFWLYYTLIALLFFWFGSTSFTSYEPMPTITRLSMPIVPGLYILAAFAAARLSFSFGRSLNANRAAAFSLIAAVVVIPFAAYVGSWSVIVTAEADAAALVRASVADGSDDRYLLLTSDVRSPISLAFYFGYEYPQNLDVLYAGAELPAPLEAYDEIFLFVDAWRSGFLLNAYGEQNCDRAINALDLPVLYTGDNVTLYHSVPPHERIAANRCD